MKPPRHPALILKVGREKSLLRRHPWVFSGGIERITGSPEAGSSVELRSARGEFLAWAAYSPHSQICARVWSFDFDQPIDEALIAHRVHQALALRQRQGVRGRVEAQRLVHAESDGLPGVIVDRFAGQLVFQFNSAGAHVWRDTIVNTLVTQTGVGNCYERSDSDLMSEEGLEPRTGVLRGEDAKPCFEENGLQLAAGVQAGHKTGFYLDQRDNRALLRERVRDQEVLDCFCYTGGFTLNAVAGGARRVTAIDASQPALDMGAESLRRNALDASRVEWVCGDVFQQLRHYRDVGRQFDLIVLDPPKFAPRAAMAERAARGYKDINLLAFKLLRPGGLLFTFSCSGGVSIDLF